MAQRKKPNPNAPNPDCKTCQGRGAYPPSTTAGMYIIVRVGKCKNPIPCRDCKP